MFEKIGKATGQFQSLDDGKPLLFVPELWGGWKGRRQEAKKQRQSQKAGFDDEFSGFSSGDWQDELRRRKGQGRKNPEPDGGQPDKKASQKTPKNKWYHSQKQKSRAAEEEVMRERQKRQAEAEEKLKRERADFERKQREFAKKAKADRADDNRNSMEILGLKSGFSQADLKKAYHEKSKRYHPNHWQNDPPEIQKAMEEEQKKVNAAYAMLKV